MSSRRVYLSLAAFLLITTIGTGFAMQEKNPRLHSTLSTLETAKLQLGMATASPRRLEALLLIDKAIVEVRRELQENHSTGS
jgi:hypothetical protein